MPIYKYTLTKYFKSISTWVIVAISMVLVFVLGGFVPFRAAKIRNAQDYAVISVVIVAAITSFLSIFTSVFAGFKSASMFKDEVEDGTFLVMLSKPLTRSKIIFFKWLALQTAVILYTLVVALSFLLAVVIFDSGHKLVDDLSALGLKTMRSQIILISLSLWAILFIVALIFSSIALLLSTKLSVGTTIGISIAIGVVIPVTSLIGTFTSKPAYKSIANSDVKLLEAMVSPQMANSDLVRSIATRTHNQQLLSIVQHEIAGMSTLINNDKTLYGLGLATNEKDTFKFAQVFDFNYQIQKLSEFASEQATPEIVRENLDFTHEGQSIKTVTNVAIEKNPFKEQEMTKQIEIFNSLVKSSWNITLPYRVAVTQLLIQALSIASINPLTPIDVPTALIDGKFTTVSSISDATKDKFIADITAADSLTTWIAKNVDSLTHDEAIKYRQANAGINKLMNSINKDHGVINFEHSGLAPNEIASFTKYFLEANARSKDVFEPITFWTAGVPKFLQDYGVTVKTYIYSGSESANHVDDKVTDGLGNLREVIRTDDYAHYNEIASAIYSGYSIAKIKTVEYSNKWVILWVYLALALALVPISYFVIRKQDFR